MTREKHMEIGTTVALISSVAAGLWINGPLGLFILAAWGIFYAIGHGLDEEKDHDLAELRDECLREPTWAARTILSLQKELRECERKPSESPGTAASSAGSEETFGEG